MSPSGLAGQRSYLQMTWVHVLPSTKEGWGLSVLEAAPCHTPRVTYDVPGLRNSALNGVKALAASTSDMLVDEQLRTQRSENAGQWALKFSWQRTSKKVVQALRCVLKANENGAVVKD
jgi:glycosyltransferase involved in cell wall biosynthesis